MDDVIINKGTTIERCLERIKQEYVSSEHDFDVNITKQDAVILNLQRACEAAIDIATHIVRIRALGVPQSSRDVFVLLENAKIIPEQLSQKLQAMVGFRNIAVHNYISLNLNIVRQIIEKELTTFTEFNHVVLTGKK